MGSCGSALRRGSDSSPWKNHHPSLVHSEVHKHSNPIPPPTDSVKEVTEKAIDQPISAPHVNASRVSPLNSVTSFSNCGSKEEAFFDSQAWIESDCDEDFYSVKGDFTPSRGSTPAYRSFPGTPLNRSLSSQVSRALFEGKSPPYYNAESNRSTPLHKSASAKTNSPKTETKRKSKKLSELFRESIRERQPEESTNSDSYMSEESPPCKEKNLKHPQGCLPRLHSVRLHSSRFLKI